MLDTVFVPFMTRTVTRHVPFARRATPDDVALQTFVDDDAILNETFWPDFFVSPAHLRSAVVVEVAFVRVSFTEHTLDVVAGAVVVVVRLKDPTELKT